VGRKRGWGCETGEEGGEKVRRGGGGGVRVKSGLKWRRGEGRGRREGGPGGGWEKDVCRGGLGNQGTV